MPIAFRFGEKIPLLPEIQVKSDVAAATLGRISRVGVLRDQQFRAKLPRRE